MELLLLLLLLQLEILLTKEVWVFFGFISVGPLDLKLNCFYLEVFEFVDCGGVIKQMFP